MKMGKTSAVPDLLCAGLHPTAISKQLGIARQTVYNIKKKLECSGTIQRKPGSGRKRSARTKPNINKIKQRVTTNPVRSMRKMAKELKISASSVGRIVSRDLKMKSRARTKVPLLPEAQKDVWVQRSATLINDLKHAAAKRVILFSDEKIFTVDAASNRRNDRWIGDVPENYSDKIKYKNSTKHPSSVMVFGLVSSDGNTMPPVFIPAGVKVNTETYVDMLCTKVKTWVDSHYPDGNYVFQQDGAPVHTSKKTQEWLTLNLAAFWSKEMWPPQSPDLNPLDYSVWATAEESACKTSHASVHKLKQSINTSWKKMSKAYIRKTCGAFRRRLKLSLAAGGGHIEK